VSLGTPARHVPAACPMPKGRAGMRSPSRWMALTIRRGTNSVADSMPGCSGQLGQPAVRPSLASYVHILHHVPDLPGALCHIKTLLAPGGLVVIRVRRVTGSLLWTSPAWRYPDGRHIDCRSPKQLQGGVGGSVHGDHDRQAAAMTRTPAGHVRAAPESEAELSSEGR